MYAIMRITRRVGGTIAESVLAQGEQIPATVRNDEKLGNITKMDSGGQEKVLPGQFSVDLNRCMERYQQADSAATKDLVAALSPALLRFFRSQVSSREQAEDLLQETWLRIHRVRRTYRPGEPVLPWVYAIARRVRVDAYRRMRRISAHETVMKILPESPEQCECGKALPDLRALLAGLPEGQREVVAMLKVGLSLEEVARATSSTVGAVKQKAHRAYEGLRKLLNVDNRKTSKAGTAWTIRT